MPGEQEYIDGIHNYCDRWCERCALTAHCRVYVMESTALDDPDALDPEDAEFWATLHESLRNSRELVQQKTVCGQHPNGETIESDFLEEVVVDVRVDEHPVWLLAQKFSHSAQRWLETNAEELHQLASSYVLQMQWGPEGESDPEHHALTIQDCLEVLRWYHLQIAVKIRRGLTGLEQLADPVDPADDALATLHLRNAHGSLKVALIGMDRTVVALTMLCQTVPELTDTSLDLLLELEDLKRRLESDIPQAREFQRPGFDILPN